MPRFAYSAVDPSGALIKGEVTAVSDISALDELSRKGLTPVTLEEDAASGPWWSREVSFGGAQTLKRADQARFFSALSTMLGAKFSLPRALKFVADRAQGAKPKRAFQTLADQVAAGATLAEAMNETAVFEDRFVGLTQIGEASNRLEDVSENIAGMLDAEMKAARQIQQALVYPAILLGMSVLVVLMLVFFLAPTLVPVFRSANVDPPGLLAFLDSFRVTLETNWPVVLASVAIICMGLWVTRKSTFAAMAGMFSVLPGIRGYVRSRHTLRLFQSLRMMLDSGAPLPAALTSAAETAPSAWQSKVTEVRTQVEAGATLAGALGQGAFLAPGALAFVEAGEESDQLSLMLGQSSRLLEDQVQTQQAQVLRLLTPLLTLVIGLTVGVLIFSTIGAILDLNDLAS